MLVDIGSISLDSFSNLSLGWQNTASVGGYRGYIDDITIDYAPPIPSNSIATSWEAFQSRPTWINTMDNGASGGNVANVTGLCCGATGPQAFLSSEGAHTGSWSLVYAGRGTGAYPSYAYAKIWDLSHSNLVLDGLSTLSYWVYPYSPDTYASVSELSSAHIALDIIFSDGSTLRDSGMTDSHGHGVTPDLQSVGLTYDTCNLVSIPMGQFAGKTPVRLDVGWSGATGGYRGLIDDISVAGRAILPRGKSPALVHITLSPASTIVIGAQIQLTATGVYSDGSQNLLGSSASYTSDNPVVATVDANGYISALAAGVARFTASLEGVTSPPYTLRVTPLIHSLGGTVSGLIVGTTVSLLQGNDRIAVDNGSFVFPTGIFPGASYDANLINPTGQTCAFVSNSNAGSMSNTNVLSIAVVCVTNKYSLGGQIFGLSVNTNVTLSNGADTLTHSNGNYSFATTVKYGHSYAISLTSPPGQSCEFTPAGINSGTMPAAPVTDANILCTANTYSLGGSVSGLITGNIVIANTANADSISVGNGNFLFDQNVSYAGSYNVTVTSPNGLNCLVHNANGVMAAGGEFNLSIACTPNFFVLGGSISGLVSNTNTTLADSNDVISVTNGNFVFPTGVAYNSNFSVSLTNPNGQTCVFVGNSNAGTMPPSNDYNIRVSCSTNSYSLGGSVSGLLANTNVTLADGNDTLSPANGTYTFPTLLPYGSVYSIGIVNPSGQSCVFSPNTVGNGNMPAASVTNANVLCTTNTYPLGGSVTGLVSGNITITNAADADAINVSNGNFVFDQNVAYAGNYNVSVASPNGLTCTVVNGNAAMPVGGQFNVIITCTANPATRLLLSAYATPRTAGQNSNVTITAYDTYNHVAIGYTGTVHITSSDTNAVSNPNFTFLTAYAGSANVPVMMTTAGTQSLSGNDLTTSGISGTLAAIVVNPNLATSLALSGYTTPRAAGQSGNITIAAHDAYGNIATGYTGTVSITSTDTNAILPGNFMFSAGNSGVAYLPVTLRTTGTWAIVANDTMQASVSGIQTGIVVNPNGTYHFVVSGYPASTTAGQQANITVVVRDIYNNLVPGYTGTVHFTSSDANAVLPSDFTFSAANAGAASFGVVLKAAGTRAISANDTVTSTLAASQAGIVVNPNAAAAFLVAGFPNPTIQNQSANVTVTAYDAYGNVATGYAGTIAFSSSDPNAVLSGNYTFQPSDAGSRAFPVTLNTRVTRSITAADTINAGISGTQTGIIVYQYFNLSVHVLSLNANNSVVYTNANSSITPTYSNPNAAFSVKVLETTTYSITTATNAYAQNCNLAAPSGTMPGADLTLMALCFPFLRFSNGQNANYVIGQSSFTGNSAGANGLAYGISQSYAPAYAAPDGSLFLVDSSNKRVVGYNSVPSSNGAAFAFVIGASSTTSSPDNYLSYPSGVSGNANYTAIQDIGYQGIYLYNGIRKASESPNVSLGNSTSCVATAINYPQGIEVALDALLVSDNRLNRVLVWKTRPTSNYQPPDVILGQPNATTCTSVTPPTASSLSSPTGVWSDGNRIMVADSNNGRVLIYNTAISALTTGIAADIVLGAPDMSTVGSGAISNKTFNAGYVSSNGQQIFVSTYQSRVLIWNSIPSSNYAAADLVLGQTDFISSACNGGGSTTANTLCNDDGVWYTSTALIINDHSNYRYLIYNSK